MSFFPLYNHGSPVVGDTILGKLGCKACPLSRIKNTSPQMLPDGPDGVGGVYFLGEAPDVDDDVGGRPFIGSSGKYLRNAIDEIREFNLHSRFNNIVRTHPLKNRAPSDVEIACCRPSIVADIEATKPAGIIGFGNAVLKWAIGVSGGVQPWRGRRIPAQIGNHRCWFYPIAHPSTILRGGDAAHGVLFQKDLSAAIADITRGAQLPDLFNIAIFDNQYLSFSESNFAKVLDAEIVTFDTETSSQDSRRDKLRPFGERTRILSMAFTSENGTVAFPIDHPSRSFDGGPLEAGALISRSLQNSKAEVCAAHNLAFDLEWILEKLFLPRDADRFLLDNRHRLQCTMAQAYVLDNRKGALKLKTLCLQYFGIDMKSLAHVDVAQLLNTDIDQVLRYNAIDAYFTKKLYLAQQERINRYALTGVAAEQHRRIPTLVAATRKGLLLDADEAIRQKSETEAELKRIEEEIQDLPVIKNWSAQSHRRFDLSSNLHLVGVLSALGINLPKTALGNVSVAANALSKVDHPLTTKILLHRQKSTLLSTFISTIAPGGKHLWPDGRLHPQFNACLTSTRRLSSSSPNGQNFPKRRNVEVRNQIIAPPGHKIVSFDFGQIEARIIAADSQDRAFVDSIISGLDIHQAWSEKILNACPDWSVAKKDRRDRAKGGMVFASFYLASPRTVAESLDISQRKADTLLNEFWSEFSGVKKWQNGLIEQYKCRGYLELMTGFRCQGAFSDFQIVNYRVQGTASDIVVGAMNRLSERGIQAILNIHDDLLFYILENDSMDDTILDIKSEMTIEPDYMAPVPLSVDVSIGDKWGSLKKYVVNK